MKRIVCICLIALASLIFASACDDHIEVQQNYDFALGTWHLPEDIKPDELVEIRFTLRRQGDFKGAKYHIGYIQMQGSGQVLDAVGNRLIDRESVELPAIVGFNDNDPYNLSFTLFYQSLSDEKSEVVFFVIDNFGLQRDLMVSFDTINPE